MAMDFKGVSIEAKDYEAREAKFINMSPGKDSEFTIDTSTVKGTKSLFDLLAERL